MKLTATKRSILIGMKNGEVLWHAYMVPKWAYLSGRHERIRVSTVRTLFQEGLIEECDFDQPDVHYRLTARGEEAIAHGK
jgi:hypothetical protein